jgi:replicative superfamily II helicase/DNA polymerase I-like protein with 3'-5' exonuclease and polymerase domains
MYASEGVAELYPWQIECLEQGEVLKGQNLVYSAPTSSGKSLVAEILMLRKILQSKKRAIVILPFVSVVAEKTNFMKRVYSPLGLFIEGYYANKGGHTLFDHEEDELNIAVCTIEKANNLLNRSVEDGTIKDFGIVIIDEIHMMGDSSRGYILELLVTKLLYLRIDHLQIIGLSATLPNIDIFSVWLNASVFVTNYRPVPLVEYVKVGGALYDKSMNKVRNLATPMFPSNDSDQLVDLCCETLSGGHSVLIFCASKRLTEVFCVSLSNLLPDSVAYPEHKAHSAPGSLSSNRNLLLAHLKRTPGGLDPTLEKGILKGIAYHHAGLTVEEREIIEQGFRSGVISILLATSTLAAGVNLPARRVIFQSPFIGIEPLDAARYQQMSGRAGRKGIDDLGESILICKPNLLPQIKTMILSDLPPLESCLVQSRRGMIRPLMDVIANGVVETVQDVERYIMSTLFAKQKHYTEVHQVSKAALRFLEENDFVEWNELKQKFIPTKLGKATVASSLSPEEGLVVFQELNKARQNIVLDTELHLVYQVTPIYHNITPDWGLYLSIYSSLPESSIRVSTLIGISEGFIISASTRRPKSTTPEYAIHTRFFASLILFDLIHEISINSVANYYQIPRGHIQTLQSNASTFSGMVHAFCSQLKWWGMEALIAQFTDRLSFGVEPDIIPLAQIPHVKGHRARVLYRHGFKTVASIAAAVPEQIEELLRQEAPYKSINDEDSNHARKIEARVAKLIVTGAQRLIGDQTHALETSVKKLKQIPNRPGSDKVPSSKRHKSSKNQSLHQKSPKSPGKYSKSSEQKSPSFKPPPKVNPKQDLAPPLPKPCSKANVTFSNIPSPNAPISQANQPPPPVQTTLPVIPKELKVPVRPILGNKQIFPQPSTVVPKQTNNPVQVTSPTNRVQDELDLMDQDFMAEELEEFFAQPIAPFLQSPPSSTKPMSTFAPNSTHKESPRNLPAKPVSNPNLPAQASLAGNKPVPLQKTFPPPSTSVSPQGSKTGQLWHHKPQQPPNQILKNSLPQQVSPQNLPAPAPPSSSVKTNLIPQNLKPPANPPRASIPTSNFQGSTIPRTNSLPQVKPNPIPTSKYPTRAQTLPAPLAQEEISKAVHPPLNQPSFPQRAEISGCDIPEEDDPLNQIQPSAPSPPSVLNRIGRIHPGWQTFNFKFKIIIVEDSFEAYEELSSLWALQPRFAFSLHTSIEGNPLDQPDPDYSEWQPKPHGNSKAQPKPPAKPKKITKKQLKLIEEMPHITNVDGISVCWNEEQCFYLSLRPIPNSTPSSSQLEAFRWQIIRKVMVHSTAQKTAYEMTQKYQLLLECGIRIHKPLLDPRIAGWMIDPEEKNSGSLDCLAERYIPAKKIVGTPADSIARNAKETMQSWILMNYLIERLKTDILYLPFRDIEMEVIPILAEMQHWGMGFEKTVCETHQVLVARTLNELEKECHRIAGRPFSLTAPAEVGKILFEEFGLPCSKKLLPKTKNSSKPARNSTSASVLQQIVKLHPLPGLILQHRKLTTLRIKYMNNLPKYSVYSKSLRMDRIHAAQLHTHVPTGRLAVKNPNLQCIAHTLTFTPRGQPGSEGNPDGQNSVAISMREAFVAAPGCVLLSGDYSQLEVRLMAHFSQDPLLISVFKRGGDVFYSLAAEWLEKPVDQVTKEERAHVRIFLIFRFCFDQ